MIKSKLLTFIFVIVAIVSYSQSEINNPNKEKRRLLKVYIFGPIFSPGNECEIQLQKTYGFMLVDGKCVATIRKRMHNKRIYSKLKKRNGENWQKLFEIKLKEC